TRLPGKPLCDIAGKPMVLRVVEQAKQAKRLDDVVVLTDDQRIFDTVNHAGFKAVMTSAQCASGTDRIAEYMQQAEGDIFVNMQGDEVLLNPQHIDRLVEDFTRSTDPQMGTLAHWVSDKAILADPSTAKIVTDLQDHALYFSRNCIPVTQSGEYPEQALIHIGVYIYSRQVLQQLTRQAQTPLEKQEKLEQLRALECGICIKVTTVDNYQSLSVDTPQDLEKARKIFQV
ncbi:MAG: 3-deoxy-manno-octulosonate cytidylyltransferase, partial [Gammaproteobacteria bacterium]|nr:3-deoxy-manno-octulosonate cytidylyltransferase [Gammaproteobacteria bacterium]